MFFNIVNRKSLVVENIEAEPDWEMEDDILSSVSNEDLENNSENEISENNLEDNDGNDEGEKVVRFE